MDYIKAVRAMRAEMNVHPAKKTSMVIETASPPHLRRAARIWPVSPLPPT